MSEGRSSERDLVLAPNEFAFVSDQTKGHVVTYVGPFKTSMAGTDQPVTFDEDDKRFHGVSMDEAINLFCIAPEGWYITLKNPALGDLTHPKTGNSNSAVDLGIGKKINLPGPQSFALWPGQMARVIQGHRLRSNQYLIARVYDDVAARRHWGDAIIDATIGGGKDGDKGDGKDDAGTPAVAKPDLDIPDADITIGKLLIIKGTDVSFYIPPTGVEVLQDDEGNHVRDAVTLEMLEYCILLEESGSKRFVRGPDVVFPEPTEVFIRRDGHRKFRAIELNERQALYIKVVKDYDEGGKKHRQGDELFISGEDTRIYFPRAEHAVIQHGDQLKHYATAVPEGEARYVLDSLTGKVDLVTGPKMLLPDPRKSIIVRRILDNKYVTLLYPGNQEALDHNDLLRAKQEEKRRKGGEKKATRSAFRSQLIGDFGGDAPVAMASGGVYSSNALLGEGVADAWVPEEAGTQMMGDVFDRSSSYTAPRMTVIANKYDGAVAVNVFTGYAMLLVSKSGERRVVVGPKTVLLEYDELPEILSLSTGKPKNTDRLLKTAYLRIKHNMVTDLVTVETSDLVEVELKLSYRMDFKGEDPERYFAVENCVKFLCDHMRSRIRNVAKQHGIEDFYRDAIPIVRDIVLGKSEEDKPRPGLDFPQNGMHVYDVEVLKVQIIHEEIGRLLKDAQRQVVAETLQMQRDLRNEELTKKQEEITQKIQSYKAETEVMHLGLQMEQEDKMSQRELASIKAEQAAAEGQKALAEINVAKEGIRHQFEHQMKTDFFELRKAEIEATVKAYVDRIKSVSPKLVEAAQTFGDKVMLAHSTKDVAPLAILGGESVVDVLQRLFAGTHLERVFDGSNGDPESKSLPKKSPRASRGVRTESDA